MTDEETKELLKILEDQAKKIEESEEERIKFMKEMGMMDENNKLTEYGEHIMYIVSLDLQSDRPYLLGDHVNR